MAFTLWPNFILLLCVVIIGSIIGFIIYGLKVGFENILKEESGKKPEEQENASQA